MLTHLAVVFLVAWGAAQLVFGWQLPPILDILVTGAMIFVGGWIAGSLLMGIYLYVSLNLFGRHGDAAFSSLSINDWKCFLRLHIASDGALRIYPIGIDRVPRRWRSGAGSRSLVPGDPGATDPRLIEPPVSVPPRSQPDSDGDPVSLG